MASFRFCDIDGVVIKHPSTFKIERYNITESSRVASGLMMMDLIAQKRKFYFTYEAIDEKDWEVILDAIWESGKVFFDLTYVENGKTKTATCYVGSIPSELHRVKDKDHMVWKNVSFNLIER